MKKLVKSLALFVISTASISTSAQNLISKISDQASFVIEINGENLFKDISVVEAENSLLFKEVINTFFGENSITNPNSFSDMGIEVNSKMYVASENQKDITYFYYSSKIKDLTKFKSFVKNTLNNLNNKTESSNNGLTQIIFDNTNRLVWNESYFIFITSVYTGERYSEDYYRSWRDYDYNDIDMTVEEATDKQKNEVIQESVLEEVYEIEEEIEEIVAVQENASDSNYENEYDKKQRKKKEAFDKHEEEKKVNKSIFIDSALTARTTLFFTDGLTTKFLPTGFDNSAVASIWYNGMDLANFSNPLSAIYDHNGGYNSTNDFLGLHSLYNAGYYTNLYLEEDRISLKSTLDFSTKLKESTDKIYNSKLDKNFSKYLPENILAYTSFSISTKDLLNESATITKSYFDSTSNFEYSQEVSVYVDLLQIILDEEAIAELMTGDVVMLLNDLSSKTVDYKTWEYDENTFDEKQVTKTKQELVPEFTIMMGSQNEELLTRLFKLSMKHKFLSKKESYFVANEKYRNELPFEMYLCFKDGILFMTNSNTQLQNILNGKAKVKLNKTQRKHIMNNIGTVYIDMEQITLKLLADETLSKELDELNEFKDDVKQVMSTSTYKNGKFNVNAYITIPEGEANSAKYLLKLVDKIVAKSKQ